ncbi:MAG: hypothetical protein IPJ25_14870 [Rhodocyclaceae bacterium]|nr:hypothetical protein [Rhodocyclaceae bacterium]
MNAGAVVLSRSAQVSPEVSALDESDQQDNANARMATGRRLIHGNGCQYPQAVGPSDLLMVDFDIRRVKWAGLYLVEAIDAGQVTWRGCRRFDPRPNGELWIDETGNGDWTLFTDGCGWRIAGYVEQVYKPASAL